MDPVEPKPLSLDRATLVPLGSVITITIFLVKIWLGLWDIEIRQDADLKDIRRQLAQRWTCRQHERFFYELRLLNPDMKVPTSHEECGAE
jgi:hypothetical protein